MILIALGANLPSRYGCPEETLKAAALALVGAGIEVFAVSSVWLSAPVPVSDQPWYRNSVVLVDTALNAPELMGVLQKTEADFGRVRSVRDAPRVLDLDLIAYNDEVCEGARLTLPHPRMEARAFVLLPLAEVAPSWVHPVLGLSVQDLIEAMPEGQEIEVSKIQEAS